MAHLGSQAHKFAILAAFVCTIGKLVAGLPGGESMHASSVLVAFGMMLGLAAQTTERTDRFSGKWEAKVKDSVVCTIHLRTEGGISGSISDCRIHVDSDGKLEEPESSESSSVASPISNARIHGDLLTFEYKDEGETDPNHFEMKLLRDGIGDLTIRNAPVNMKPIRFIRVPSTK